MESILLIITLIIVIVAVSFRRRTIMEKSTHKSPKQIANIEQQEKEQITDEVVAVILPTINNDQ